MEKTPVDYELLAIFVAVADRTSFSKAAQSLGIGKGTVSRAIAELERQVGAELLHRTTHRVALSTAGTALYERAAPHLSALDQAVRKLPEREEEPAGLLRLTAYHDIASEVLPELVAQFTMRHPAVLLDIRVNNQDVDLVAEGFDLAIRASIDRLRDSRLTARSLGRVKAGVYAAPSYLARRGEPRQFGDPKHDWVVFTPVVERIRSPKSFRPRLICDDMLTLRNLLREGAGVGPLPTYVAAPSLADGTLVEISAHPSLHRMSMSDAAGLYIIYPTSGQVPRKVTAFRDFVIDRLKAKPL
jgi:DNA-binding transcriptional LysR family regulator